MREPNNVLTGSNKTNTLGEFKCNQNEFRGNQNEFKKLGKHNNKVDDEYQRIDILKRDSNYLYDKTLIYLAKVAM